MFFQLLKLTKSEKIHKIFQEEILCISTKSKNLYRKWSNEKKNDFREKYSALKLLATVKLFIFVDIL